MKKVRLDLKKNAKTWSFVLYDSPESAFYLKDDPIDEVDKSEESLEVDYRRVITLKRGEMIEVEWLGSEWAYEVPIDDIVASGDLSASSKHEKYDKIRLCKLVPIEVSHEALERLPAKAYLELYSGWVTHNEIPWTPKDKRRGLKITLVNEKVLSKLDFSKIFVKHKPEDDESEIDLPKVMSSVLN